MISRAVVAALFVVGVLVAFAAVGSSRPPCWAKHGSCPPTTTTTTTPTTTPTTTTVPTTTSPPPPVGAGGWGLLQYGGSLSNIPASEQQAASLIVVSPCCGDPQTASALPGRSLVYMDATCVRHDGGSGVDWQTASNLGYLTGVESSAYACTFAKIDSSSYRSWFGQQAQALVRADGVDGVMLDDIGRHMSGGSPYSDAQMTQYTPQIAAAVGTGLHSSGYYLLINASGYAPGLSGADDGSSDLAWWELNAPNVDAIMTEFWVETRDGSDRLRLRGSEWYQHWDEWMATVETFHADFPSKDFTGLTYGDDAHLIYGRASLMLADPAGLFLGHRLDDSDPYGPWTGSGTPHVDPVAGTASIG